MPFFGGESREETRTRERKTEKNCELGVFGGTSDFNIIIGGLDLKEFCCSSLIIGIVCINSSNNLYFYFVTHFCILIY